MKKRKKKLSTTTEEKLISETFLPKSIRVDASRVFPVVVMATMSSGKSTLVNTMLGIDILPSKNEACTAKVYSILDDDTIKHPKIYVEKNDGTLNIIQNDLSRQLNLANDANNVKSIFISGQIKGVLNTDKALLLIDTPGPNNSQDATHEAILQDTLKKIKGGLILYVMNASQVTTKDDKYLLTLLREFLEKNKQVKVLFIVNKVDVLDLEKESISEFVFNAKSYIEGCGIKNPDIIPVSARAANLFKKVLAGDSLSRKQYNDFLMAYDMFRPSGVRMTAYAITKDLPDQRRKLQVNGETFVVGDLLAALDNTGITYCEKYIQEAQILSNTNAKAIK